MQSLRRRSYPCRKPAIHGVVSPIRGCAAPRCTTWLRRAPLEARNFGSPRSCRCSSSEVHRHAPRISRYRSVVATSLFSGPRFSSWQAEEPLIFGAHPRQHNIALVKRCLGRAGASSTDTSPAEVRAGFGRCRPENNGVATAPNRSTTARRTRLRE